MPDWKPEIRRRLDKLKLEAEREEAIVEELAQYLDDCYAELLAAGAAETEAWQRTLAELSESDLLASELRRIEREIAPDPIVIGTTRRRNMIADLWQDLRFGARMLARQPGFTLIAVITLALGIGANTAIFTLLDKALIRALNVDEPQQLVTFNQQGSAAPAIFSYPLYAELRERNEVLAGLAAYYQQPFSLSTSNQSERITGQIVSGNYFSVLGVRPALGRFFLPEEDRTPGSHAVLVISHGLWRRHFGADPAVIGTTASLNGHSYTIIGVVPSEFTGTLRGTVNDVYVPAMMQAQAQPGRNSKLEDRGSGWLRLIGRLRSGVSRETAQASLSALAAEAKKAYPGTSDPESIFLADGSRGHTDRISDLALPLKLLMGVVGLVLLIACANVASLLLARASARSKEIAIRLSIGASRARIVRQLLTESAILAVLGGGAGLIVAAWVAGLLAGLQQQTNFVPRTFDASLDLRVLGFTLGLSLLTGFVFGLAPAMQATRPDLLPALKEEGSGRGLGARRLRMRNLLVVAQVALSVVVLIGAGLCVKSLLRLQAIDPGFETARVVTASFDLSQSGYDEARGGQFLSRLLERIAALPGVEATSLARGVVLSDFVWTRSAAIEGYQPKPGERLAFDFNAISPDYFRTLGTRLARGREFNADDNRAAPRVVIVNEAAARRYWAGQEAVGKRLKYGNADQFAEVVGVVKDSRSRSLVAEARPTIYVPLLQNYAPDLTLHVRAAVEAQSLLAAVRAEVRALDAQLPLYNLRTLDEQRNGSLYGERLAATLLTLFGLLALLLSAVGLYGVLSYAVAAERREFGIRLALGARPRDLLKLVVGHGMILTLAGIVIGAGASLALTRLVERLLFGVSATDPAIFAAIALLLAAVAFIACYLPARRAMSVDPMIVLRSE